MTDYYVYCIFDTDGTPRYIGASGSTRFETWSCPSNWGYNPVGEWVRSIGGPPEIRRILLVLSFEEASIWEAHLIEFIGRQCDGTGPLFNVQQGGLSKKPGRPPKQAQLGPRLARRGLVVSQWVHPNDQKPSRDYTGWSGP